MTARRLALALLAGSLALSAAGRVRPPARGSSPIAVWSAGTWRTFWRPDRAPERWADADSVLIQAVAWKRLAPGLEWASLRLACGAPVWRTRLIVARLDPRQISLSLVMDLTRDARPAWSIDRTPKDALFAVNAGQFGGAMPWGWVVIDRRQRLRPAYGPLASAVAIDTGGRVRWAHGDSLTAPESVIAGFQSYPTLLAGDGVVPPALRIEDRGVNLAHRDARLALGQTRDGRILVAMTRYDAIGEAGDFVPLGPTTPEMAGIMGALGACDAVMLDGGISAQMLLKGSSRQAPQRWPGLRKVPLGLIARPRR